ncbi:IclR family transcriptional regulator, partial [Streptomyces sp. SID8455]|nr:IclR family transcriptional regulator [Streptomyces sp. SID8455]
GAAVYLSRYVDGEVSVTQVADGPLTPAVNEWVDFRSSAHASAVGKCLLAQLDHEGRRDHLSRHRIARLTSRTITSEKVLLSKLEAQPATVPVLDLQEYAVGTVCAAVP